MGCSPSLGAQRLQSFLGALYVRAPQLDVEVFHLASAEQCRRLRELELDLALLDVCDGDAGIETLPLFPGDPLALFVPLHHPLAGQERIEPARVAGLTLLTHSPSPGFHEWLVSVAARAGYDFANFDQRGGDDARDLLFAVAEGHGVAIAPLSLGTIAGDLASLVTPRPLEPPQSMPDSRLAWCSDPPRRLRDVLALAREAAAQVREGALAVVAAPVSQYAGASPPTPFLAAGTGGLPQPRAAALLRDLSVAFASAHGASGHELDEVAASVARAVGNALAAAAADDGDVALVELEARVHQRVLDVAIVRDPRRRRSGEAIDAAARLRFVLGD